MFRPSRHFAALILIAFPAVLNGAQRTVSSSFDIPPALWEQARGARHVAIAKALGIQSEQARNQYGDKVIVTRVRLQVQKRLKGQLSDQEEMIVEGGTLNGLTLEVSDMPRVKKGDEMVVFVDDAPGGVVPHQRGQGIRFLGRAAGGARSREMFAVMTAKWNRTPVLYYVNPNNMDVSPDAALMAIQRAANTWSTASRAKFAFQYAGSTDVTEVSNNGKNEILFRNEVSPSGAFTTATTYSWWDSNGNLVDSDLVFWDGAFLFHVGNSTCTEGAYIENVATHELGHVLGLRHSDVVNSTMSATAPPCDQSAITLEPDDIAGLEALYP